MNKINKNYDISNSVASFAKNYFSYLSKILNNISEVDLNRLVEAFEEARVNGKTIFIVGNGGSAATATTMANDIGFDIIKKTSTDLPFRMLSLVDNPSVLTAIANDVGYENIFVKQLMIHYRDGDYLLAISASGNSPNIIKASEWIKSKGGKVIGFLGFDGGELMKLCDYKIHVSTEAGEYGPVEDAHLIVNHILAHWFQNKYK